MAKPNFTKKQIIDHLKKHLNPKGIISFIELDYDWESDDNVERVNLCVQYEKDGWRKSDRILIWEKPKQVAPVETKEY